MVDDKRYYICLKCGYSTWYPIGASEISHIHDAKGSFRRSCSGPLVGLVNDTGAEMKCVILEYPRIFIEYPDTFEYHELYPLACMLDSLERGEAPVETHTVEMRFAYREVSDATIVYRDLGYTNDMLYSIEHAVKVMKQRPHFIEYRELGEAWANVKEFARAVDNW